MKNPIRTTFWTLVGLVLAYLFFKSGFFDYVIAPSGSFPTPFPIMEVREILFREVITYNIAYLTLSIIFISILAGVFYMLNIKPLESRLLKQESDLSDTKMKMEMDFQKQISEMTARIDGLRKEVETSIAERTGSAERRLVAAETRVEDIQLDLIWNQHFVWQTSKFYANDIMSLIFFLQLVVEIYQKPEKYKSKIVMCLNQILRVLDEDDGTSSSSVMVLSLPGRTARDVCMEHFATLNRLFPLITDPDFVFTKSQIIQKCIEKWFVGTYPQLNSQ